MCARRHHPGWEIGNQLPKRTLRNQSSGRLPGPGFCLESTLLNTNAPPGASNSVGSFTHMHRRLSGLAVSLLAAASLTSAFAQTAPAAASNPPTARIPLQELSESFEKLASKVRPCVVQIFSTGYAPITSEDGETTNTQSLLSRQQATGAGVIVSPDGYIVTNSH